MNCGREATGGPGRSNDTKNRKEITNKLIPTHPDPRKREGGREASSSQHRVPKQTSGSLEVILWKYGDCLFSPAMHSPAARAKDDRGDPKVVETKKVVNAIKASNAIMPDFLKAVQKYHQQLHALNQTSQALLFLPKRRHTSHHLRKRAESASVRSLVAS